MKQLTSPSIGLFATLLIVASSAFAQEDEKAQSLKDALAKGDASLAFRYRYELVDDDRFEEDAHASTLRTALGYRTLPYKGFSLFVQAQNVAPVFNDDLYNNAGAGALANDVSDRPVVADPGQTRMEQVYLRIDALDTAFDLGRREIAYGDHRFIGDVGWRQNHQAFDAIYFMNRSLERLSLSYTYADRVIRVTGAEQDMGSHMLNGLFELDDAKTLEVYGYLLELDDVPELSSQSYGLRLSGSHPVSAKWKVWIEAEYARQSGYRNNPADFAANYLELMGGLGYESHFNVRVARELLGAAEGALAFQTPLATGHKFNGWADRFLTTPPGGLVDVNVMVDGRVGAVSWLVHYHDFGADDGGSPYGSELDAQITYPTPWKQLVAAKLALYREDGFATDVSKFWFWTQYTF